MAHQLLHDTYQQCVGRMPGGSVSSTDHVQVLINIIECPFSWAFAYMLHWPLMIVASFLVLQWHMRHVGGKMKFVGPYINMVNEKLGPPRKIQRMLGLNLIILLFYYNGSEFHIEKQAQFCNTIIIIALDNVVLFYFFSWFATLFEDATLVDEWTQEQKNPVDRECEDEDRPAELADNKYQQILMPTRRVIPLFLIQCGLFMLYVDNMNGNDVPSKSKANVQLFYWFVGVLIQMYAGDTQLGPPYNRTWWTKLMVDGEEWKTVLRKVLDRNNEKSLPSLSKTFYGIPTPPVWFDWLARMLMDFIVNALLRDVIKYTFPIMLCAEDPLDFVKDCTAVFFIVQLDDLQDEENDLKIDTLTALMKFRFFYESEDIINVPLTPDEKIALTTDEPEMVSRIQASPPHKLSFERFLSPPPPTA
eukprot:CAMPEP_0194548160 /NCGR_PEP_ID=MMETSP0253-20130528/93194_1 /TAXON_ID=2966 /ORGANISM="Noctiluca scintillans" /LENGTH=416 /DNA_ID=CAMNT_0039395443 /DNA_START=61 /DNA_END=1311 /DNA_ORIENTATION=+